MRATRVFVSTAAVGLILSLCSASSDGSRARDQSSESVLNSDSSSIFADADLPSRDVNVDEDGPRSVAEAMERSDYVVVATIVEQQDGARFFGQSDESMSTDAFESVDWTLKVERWIKGRDQDEAIKSLIMRATPYLVDARSNTRIARIKWSNIQFPLDFDGRYVFFLENDPHHSG